MGSSGKVVVFAGPSGSGKSTLIKKLMADHPDAFAFSVSHTTRKARPGEVNGREYHFVSVEEMKEAIDRNEFIEHAVYSANMYGTSKKSVEDVARLGKTCILDIDMQGVKSIKETDLKCTYVFIKPPSMDILIQRLSARGTEDTAALEKRIETAKQEMAYAEIPGSYDHTIVNDDVDVAYKQLLAVLKDFL